MDGRPTFDALNAQRITVLLFDARGRVELCLGAPHDPAVYRTDPALHRAASALDESGLDRFPLELGGRVGELHSLRGVWQRYLAVLPRARPGDSPSDLMSPRQYEVACYAAAGATEMVVGTQSKNFASLALYQACGFRVRASQLTLHAHLGEDR